MSFEIAIPYEVSEELAESLESNLTCLSPLLDTIFLDRKRGKIQYTLKQKDADSQIQKLLNELLERMSPERSEDAFVKIFQHQAQHPFPQEDPFTTLAKRREVVETASGAFALRGEFLRLYRVLDERTLEFAHKQGAEDLHVPVSTSIESLQRSHFFDRTPHFAQFLSKFPPDASHISAAAKALAGTAPSTHWNASLETPTTMCRSAICLSCYPLMQNEVLSNGKNKSFTVFGQAFRNEGKNLKNLERLQEFSMREIVYFGSKDFVSEKLKECAEWFQKLMEDLDLQGAIQTANDPFFAENFQKLQLFQLATQSKFEVRLFNPATKGTVSVGSINNHGHHFAKAFEIRTEDSEFAVTGCVGFGFERLIYLVFAQYGADTKSWPSAVKKFFKL